MTPEPARKKIRQAKDIEMYETPVDTSNSERASQAVPQAQTRVDQEPTEQDDIEGLFALLSLAGDREKELKQEIKRQQDTIEKLKQEWKEEREGFCQAIWPELNELMQDIKSKPLPSGLLDIDTWRNTLICKYLPVPVDRLGLIPYYLNSYFCEQKALVLLLLSTSVFVFKFPEGQKGWYTDDPLNEKMSLDFEEIASIDISEPIRLIEQIDEQAALELLEKSVSPLLSLDRPMDEGAESFEIDKAFFDILLGIINQVEDGDAIGVSRDTDFHYDGYKMRSGITFYIIYDNGDTPCIVCECRDVQLLTSDMFDGFNGRKLKKDALFDQLGPLIKQLSLNMFANECGFGCIMDFFSGIWCEIDFEKFEQIKAQHKHTPQSPKTLPIKYTILHYYTSGPSFILHHLAWTNRAIKQSQHSRERMETLGVSEFYKNCWWTDVPDDYFRWD